MYDLQNDFDLTKKNEKDPSTNGQTARSAQSPKSTNYTFTKESETKTNQGEYQDRKWFKFTSDKTNHHKTFNTKPKYEGMNFKPGFMPNPNASTQRKNFYEEYKKYFDSDVDFDELSDDGSLNNMEDLNNDWKNKTNNNTNKKTNNNKSNSYNGSTRPKWNKNWTTEENNKSQAEDSFSFSDEYNQDKKYTNDDPINGRILTFKII